MKGNVMKRLMLWFLLAVLFLSSAPSWAADGGIDTTFGTGGRVTTDFGPYDDEANAVAIQADDKIVAAGTTGGTDRDFALARYNTDGTLDTTFGTGGKVTTDFTDIRGTITTWGRSDSDNANAVAIQSDGKIVAAGTAGVTDFALARYNTDGTLDTTFGTGGRVTTYSSANTPISSAIASAVAIQSDGKIVVAGYAYNSDQQVNYNQYDFALARFNTDGTFDSTFGTGGIVVTAVGEGTDYDYAYAVAIQTDGKIVAAGATGPRSNYGGTDDKFALVRYNTNGTLDTSFGTGGMVTTTNYDKAYAVAIQSDGKIVAAGHGYSSSSYYTDFVVVRYLTGAATPTPTPLSTPSPTVTSSSTPLSTPTPSSEKGSISGDITDMEGKPIESAKIRLKGKQTKVSKRTTSDEDGYFEFTDLDADTYTIIATRKGYKKGKQVVTLGKGEDADVEIELKKAGKRIIKASAL